VVICFRLNAKKDSPAAMIGAATLQQIVRLIFERVDKEDSEAPRSATDKPVNRHPKAPQVTRPSVTHCVT
jgi:hypothetical protein